MEVRTVNIPIIFIIVLSIVIVQPISCKDNSSSIYKFSRFILGTMANLTIVMKSEEDASRVSERVFEEIMRIENLLSPYRSMSDIYRINRFSYKAPVSVSGETLSVIQRSIEISSLTDGRFDITFASLSHIWDFNKEHFIPPGVDEILQYLPMVNYRHIILDARGCSVRITRSGTKISLGGIAKGYAIERGIMLLKAMGVKDSILEIGGDLQVLGKKFGKHWKIGLMHPRKRDIIISLVLPSMYSIASSGDYERFAIFNNQKYHHIIDPKTGFPARTFASVSVISKDPVESDAYATALFVMGRKRARSFLKQNRDIYAIFVDLEMRIAASKELKEKIISLEDVEIEWM